MYNYSFIIPHKNNPALLNRCIGSIPQRKDIQIIVVDDNSDVEKKPSIDRDDVEIVSLDLEQSKGAGRARNIGLEHANGKWLLFADADDYYQDDFINILDNYKEYKGDIVYFNVLYLNRMGVEVKGGSRLNRIISKFDNSKEYRDLIKYRIHAPWNKMIKKSYVDNYGFRFEEVAKGNDTMFSYQIGYFSNDILVIPYKIYVYTVNNNSITHQRLTFGKCLTSLKNIKKNIAFYEFIGHKEWGDEVNVRSLLKLYLRSCRLYDAVVLIYTYLTQEECLGAVEGEYVDLVKRISEKNESNTI